MSSDSGPPGNSPDSLQRITQLERETANLRHELASLRESENYWRSMVQFAPLFFSIVDREGRLLFLNRPAKGYRPDEILGRSILEATVPEHRELIRETLDRVFETESTLNYEACDVNQNRWYSNTVGPFYKDGTIHAVIQCSEDITDKLDMRRRLADSESRWQALLENAPDTIVLIDARGKVRFINHTTEAYTPEEVIGQQGVEFLLERDRKPLATAIAQVFATGQPQEVEVTESREGRTFVGRFAMIGSFAGEPMAIAILRDVTQERRRQQALLDSETRLRVAVQQAPVVLWTTDSELRFTSTMGAGLAQLGSSPNQNNGRSLFDYFVTDDPTLPAIEAHREALQGQSVEYSQAWNGLTFQSHVEPLRDVTGEIVGVVGISLNVTARHRTELELRQAGSELEAHVKQRTAELDSLNQRLREDIERRSKVERELRESENRFRVIAQSLPVAVAIVRRADHGVMYVNRQACDLFGTSSESLYNGAVHLPCAEPTLHEKCMPLLDQGQTIEDLEVECQRADGTGLWLSVSIASMQFQGEAAYICGMLDTTRRKQAEEELVAERILQIQLRDTNQSERQMMAYEIHDGFLQDVTAAVMHLDTSQETKGQATGQAASLIGESLELLRNSVEVARRTINNLRPEVLEEAGLVAAVEELIARTEELFDMEIEFHVSLPPGSMVPTLEMTCYRVIQQALENVHQHSQSPKAEVSLKERDQRVHIEIRDWGIGFDPQKTPKKRYGLTGMLERPKLLGGHTTIKSCPGEGTHVCVELPLIMLTEPKK